MKLKKITAYIYHIQNGDTRTTIIPSGFKGGYIIIEESSDYTLGACYVPFEMSKDLLKALKSIRKGKRNGKGKESKNPTR